MAWERGRRLDRSDGPIPNDTGTITFPVGVLADPMSHYAELD